MEINILDGYTKNLESQINKAIEVIRKCCGHKTSDDLDRMKINFYYNSRLTSSWGRCTLNAFMPNFAKIEFAKQVYILPEKNQIEVIIHELLHSICPIHTGHRGRWADLAYWINQTFDVPYRITTRVNDEAKEAIKENDDFCKNSKYKIVCKNCGNTIYRDRRNKVINHIECFRCAHCKGELQLFIL